MVSGFLGGKGKRGVSILLPSSCGLKAWYSGHTWTFIPRPLHYQIWSTSTGSWDICSGFPLWTLVLLFWVSGNFPHFLINPVIAFKRMFITTYSSFSRCFILGGSSSKLIFHNTGNESCVRHFTWIILLILHNNALCIISPGNPGIGELGSFCRS